MQSQRKIGGLHARRRQWCTWYALALVTLVPCTFVTPAGSASRDAKQTRLGIGYSPAHMPFPSNDDITGFFDEAARIGSSVTWICDWHSMPSPDRIRVVRSLARSDGLKLHLYLAR